MNAPTLSAIAARITEHLKRFEGDAEANADSQYRNPSVSTIGAAILICYVQYYSYQSLHKSDALAYLARLDAGNVGKHWEMRREEK